MSCNVQVEENYSLERGHDDPTFAGTLRFLLGLTLMFAGLYVAVFGNFQGHGLGFFLVFASPLIMFKDDEEPRDRRL
jgi:hypothetical protein